jgi:hypothetical protein
MKNANTRTLSPTTDASADVDETENAADNKTKRGSSGGKRGTSAGRTVRMTSNGEEKVVVVPRKIGGYDTTQKLNSDQIVAIFLEGRTLARTLAPLSKRTAGGSVFNRSFSDDTQALVDRFFQWAALLYSIKGLDIATNSQGAKYSAKALGAIMADWYKVDVTEIVAID